MDRKASLALSRYFFMRTWFQWISLESCLDEEITTKDTHAHDPASFKDPVRTAL